MDAAATLYVKTGTGRTEILVPVNCRDYSDLPSGTFVWYGYEHEGTAYKAGNYISIEAEHYTAVNETDSGRFTVLRDYGRTLSALKAFPVNTCFIPAKNAPSVDYLVYVDREDEYEVTLYAAPSNPVSMDNKLEYGISCGAGNLSGKQAWDEETDIINLVPSDHRVGDDNYFWGQGVLDNIRKSTTALVLNKGLNTIRIFAASPGFVLEKIVINAAGEALPDSYLGPKETYRVG